MGMNYCPRWHLVWAGKVKSQKAHCDCGNDVEAAAHVIAITHATLIQQA